MRQIKTFELYKSTYISAAKKLVDSGHKKRASLLKMHAFKNGITAFDGKNNEFQRDYPHPFIFYDSSNRDLSFIQGSEVDHGLFGRFFITGYEINKDGIRIIFKSDFGNTIYMDIDIQKLADYPVISLRVGSNGVSKFKFENRSDAVNLLKYIKEIMSDDDFDSEFAKKLKKYMRVNRFYKSE